MLESAGARGAPWVSLGMDTNRYGHHLPIGLPAYKLRIGFTPLPWEPSGREVARPLSFEVFEDGLFFFSYEGAGLAGQLFTRRGLVLSPVIDGDGMHHICNTIIKVMAQISI